MTDEEKILLRRRWQFTNEFKRFGNVMFKYEGFGVLDFRTDGVLILEDSKTEFPYSLTDRILELSSPANSKNVLRLRIGELAPEKLTIGISGKRGDEIDGKFHSELVELTYRPIDE